MLDFSGLFKKHRDVFIDEILAKKTTFGRQEMLKEFDSWYIRLMGDMTSKIVEELKEKK